MRDELAASKADIDACTDTAILVAWYDHADDMAESVKANIEARELGDISDDEWFYRASDKFSYCKVAMKRIEKRLYRLGYDGRLMPGTASVSDINEIRRDLWVVRRQLSGLERGK